MLMKRKAGARPNGERERRSRAPVMAVFIRHIDSDVNQYSGFASMCARHYTFVCSGLTCSTRPFGEREKVRVPPTIYEALQDDLSNIFPANRYKLKDRIS